MLIYIAWGMLVGCILITLIGLACAFLSVSTQDHFLLWILCDLCASVTANDWHLVWRISLFFGACLVHCMTLVKVESVKLKQPHYPKWGQLDGEYAQDLEANHGGLGKLNNIGYTNYLLVLEDVDLRCSWIRYWVGQAVLLSLFWLLFRDRLC